MRDSQIKNEQLKRRNKVPEEQLHLAENGKNVGNWGHGDGKACG